MKYWNVLPPIQALLVSSGLFCPGICGRRSLTPPANNKNCSRVLLQCWRFAYKAALLYPEAQCVPLFLTKSFWPAMQPFCCDPCSSKYSSCFSCLHLIFPFCAHFRFILFVCQWLLFSTVLVLQLRHSFLLVPPPLSTSWWVGPFHLYSALLESMQQLSKEGATSESHGVRMEISLLEQEEPAAWCHWAQLSWLSHCAPQMSVVSFDVCNEADMAWGDVPFVDLKWQSQRASKNDVSI